MIASREDAEQYHSDERPYLAVGVEPRVFENVGDTQARFVGDQKQRRRLERGVAQNGRANVGGALGCVGDDEHANVFSCELFLVQPLLAAGFVG